MADLSYITNTQIQKILEDVIKLFFIPKFDSYKMNATGNWKKRVEAIDNQIWGQPYSKQLADGRPPGLAPPITPLKDWAMAKFGLGEREALGMAFAVSKNIAKSGTSWYQKGGTDLLNVLKSPEVITYINKEAAKIITELVSREVKTQLQKQFR
jgi:hypothetical protein